MKTIEDVKKLFSTFNFDEKQRADIWLSRHNPKDFKNESSEDNFDNGRALEEVIQWVSQNLLYRIPGKSGYDLLALDDTTFECKKIILPKSNKGKTTFVIKNAHPNSKNPPEVKLADYYILGEYHKRMIMIVPKERVAVVTSASVQDPNQKTDYKGVYHYDSNDVIWKGNPDIKAPESWREIKSKIRDYVYFDDNSIENILSEIKL